MKKILFTLATLLFIGSWVNRALAWEGRGTEAEPYLIQNTLDWDTLSIKTNAGEIAAGIYFKLTGDISAKVCVGTSEHPFQGRFDGGGFTIAATLTASSGTMAPFAYIQNASISHLKVTGTIDGGWYAAGVVGEAKAGTNVIEDCRVSATINARKQTGNYAWVIGGGILGNGASATVNVRGCLFDGNIKTDASIDRSYAGAIVGWCEDDAHISVNDCVENATSEVSTPYSEWIRNVGMVFKNGVAQNVKDGNNYSLVHDWEVVNHGYKVVAISDDLHIYFSTNDHVYPTTGIKPLVGNGGLVFNETCYAAGGNTVTVQTFYPSGYTGILLGKEFVASASGSSCDITMPYADVYLSLAHEWKGGGTQSDPYALENDADWQQLASEVMNGNTHAGHYFQLSKNISAYMPVGDEEHVFSGKLDGGGHTLTVALQGGDFTAPFVSIKNAELSHLHVAGRVEGGMHAAGLVGFSVGTNVITDCRVSASVVANSTHAGGFIGHAKTSTTTLRGCRMDGAIVNRGQLQYAGFFFGWSEGTAILSLNDCLCTGSSQGANRDLSWSYTYGQDPAAACGTVNNTYHNGTFGLGKQYHTITTGSPVLQLDFGTLRDNYPTSELQTFSKGLKLGELYLAGSGEKVRFNVSTATGFSFSNLTASTGSLGTYSGGYELTMGAADVVLSASIASTGTLQGSGTEANPYLIVSTSDWMKLCADVAGGQDYAGKVFRMTRDVDTNGMMVGASGKPFRGTFDGDGYTLTFNAGQQEKPVSTQLTAPFVEISGATIRHLKTTGAIYTNAKFAAGIAARVSPSAVTRLYDCSSDMTILSYVDGDGSHGGLLADVNSGVDSLVIEKSSFTGNLLHFGSTTRCGGFVGRASTAVTIRYSIFDPQGEASFNSILDGSTFARMDTGKELSLTDCYATMHMNTLQGTFIVSDIDVPNGVTYEFQGEPIVTLNDKQYYTTGCRVSLRVPEGLDFDHWVDGFGCFISDPWTAEGIHQLKDLRHRPSLHISSRAIPSAETERTMWGVTYRYLSRRDYHFFISDEDREAMGWSFESDDSDANLVVYTDGNASEITAVTGYKESSYNSDGVQIHNDLVGDWRNHTHLGMIAPHAFRNSTALKTMYFKDTDANNYNARTAFKFYIGEGAFEGCTNFEELKMMQYTTKGSNHWEALTPDQVVSVADDAFTGCQGLNISVWSMKYQDYLSSATWQQHRSRFIIYEATTEDFTVNGVKYHYYRSANQTKSLKNDESGKSQMMDQIRTWNADYQQFNAASLLETKDDCNVYYTSIVGVDNDDIDDAGGTMRIYNDPGSYYNYKTIQLGRNAIAGNTHVKNIEFYQTNGRSANSYSNLKMVIPNGAFKGCNNLHELRLYIYVEDGDDHWETLGPKDVVLGDNIFGEPSPEEMDQMTDAELEGASWMPHDFRFIVSPDRYQEFLDDPNWFPYLDLVEPIDFEPNGKKEDFSKDGLTYGYMTSPGGILQTSQVVSQDVSWWTAARIGIEVAIMVGTLGSAIAAHPSNPGLELAETQLANLQAQLPAREAALTTAKEATQQYSSFFTRLSEATRNLFKFNAKEQFFDLVDDLPKMNMLNNELLENMNQEIADYLIQEGVLNAQNQTFTKGSIETLKEIVQGGSMRQWGRVVGEMMRGLRSIKNVLLAREIEPLTAYNAYMNELARLTAVRAGRAAAASLAYYGNIVGRTTAMAAMTNVPVMISANCWGKDGYNSDQLRKGMRENILSNIHQVGFVGEGYVITTPQKNLVYHTYVKDVGDNVTEAVIYAGQKEGTNASNRTMTFARKAFRDKKNLQKVSFHENLDVTSNASMPMLLTIPDSAFMGCTALTEFSTLLQTKENGTRALGPENFVLAGDSIFAGLKCKAEVDSLTAIGQGDGLVPFYIVIDPLRKQDYLDNASWAQLQHFFKYESANPKEVAKEYGARYAYAYEQNTLKKEHKRNGHLIEHTVVIGPDDDFISKHQGAVKLCNDIGTWNNYQLDEVRPNAFKGNEYLRTVSFTDLYGFGGIGDTYSDFQIHIGDSAFADCKNLANLDLVYMATDGTNHLDPIKPQQVTIGNGVFEGTDARIKMMPQQVEWFEADSAWAKYKDRFLPCIIKLTDPIVQLMLKPMAYYDPANTGSDDALWTDYVDLARIAGVGFDWLDDRFFYRSRLNSFPDFKYFECVGLDYVGESWFDYCIQLSNIQLPSTIKTIRRKAFNHCFKLTEIELPQGIQSIESEAFGNCVSLASVIVRDSVPPTLDQDVFYKHDGLKIYVPEPCVSDYKAAWSEYAPYIVGDNEYQLNKVVTVTEVGQLAEKLGLDVHITGDKVEYLVGPYARYDSLTVRGPLNGLDLAVIRHLAGANAYDSDPTDGRLRYLNLWDADLKKDKTNSYNGYGVDEYLEKDNWVGEYLFHNCNALETLILPASVTEIGENTFQDAKSLKRIVVGRNTTTLTRDLLQNLEGIEELVFLTESPAKSSSSDPWEAPIEQVWALPSQVGAYMGDPGLVRQAMDIMAPLQSDYVMWKLAEKGHFFPTEYFKLENVEGIFEGDTEITNLDDFGFFYKVKSLLSTFRGMTSLKQITIPNAVDTIAATAFANCDSLMTIRINNDSVPRLAKDAFKDLPADFQILVPKRLCMLYRERWAQYADHINTDKSHYMGGDILTITVNEPNTVAQKLGLSITSSNVSWLWNGKYVNSVKGDYSKVTRLKIIGPISAADLDVLRYLAGWCPWTNSRNYAGHLEYLDLYDANLVSSDFCVRGRKRSLHILFVGQESDDWFSVDKNTLPHHAFLKAYNLRTLILPRTCTTVNERALQECEGLEALVIGDDCTEFNWNALDDDAMLTRLYLLTTQKVNITEQNALWQALCNNYIPTFDAFYVRPSVYNDYIYDQTYINDNYTSLISKGEFTNDDDFVAFASHAAATIDDVSTVTNVDGWFDTHNNVRDITLLGYSSVSQLRAADIQKLTKLEKVMMPATLEDLEDSLFAHSPNLQYVDFLNCDSTNIVADLRNKGFSILGIDSLQTLVYMPRAYGETEGVNIIVAGGTELRAKTYRLADGKDYAVPYTFIAGNVQNSRVLRGQGKPYATFLPYKLTLPNDVARVYKPTGREGSMVTFVQIPTGEMEAFVPYVIRPAGQQASLDSDKESFIPAMSGLLGSLAENQWVVPGYTMRGTLGRIDNKTADELDALILVDGTWQPVPSGNEHAYIAPFRAYMLQNSNSGNAPRMLTMSFLDDETDGIDTIRTIDLDGTEHYYDLSGRELPGRPEKGIFIQNGKKYIAK